jgi:hypothetical protein
LIRRDRRLFTTNSFVRHNVNVAKIFGALKHAYPLIQSLKPALS